MKLLWKFNLAFVAVFCAGVLGGGYLAWHLLSGNAYEEVLAQGRLLMDKATAVKRYTSSQLQPLLEGQRAHAFVPQSVPAYAATEVLNALRPGHPDFYYKEAVLNPSNPRDRAVDWEAGVVQRFRDAPSLAELVGERETTSGRSLYLARPIRIGDARCLGCHSTVEAAPKAEPVDFQTSRGWQKRFNRVGIASFTLMGKPATLIGYDMPALSFDRVHASDGRSGRMSPHLVFGAPSDTTSRMNPWVQRATRMRVIGTRAGKTGTA